VSADVTNIGTVTCDHQLGQVSDSDDATVNVINPALSVTKECEPATQTASGTITWTININNDGDVELTVLATDDQSATQPVFDGVIPPFSTETIVYQTNNLAAGTYTNTVVVTGDHQLGELTDNATATCEVTGNFGGLTPGFWKNNARNWGAGAWATPYEPGTTFASAFGCTVTGKSSGLTLIQALNLGGGGPNALARHAVAALLNAALPDDDLSYFLTVDEVKSLVCAAYASGEPEITDTKDELASNNELGADGISQHYIAP